MHQALSSPPGRRRRIGKVAASALLAYAVAWGLTATLGVRGARGACGRERDVVDGWSGWSPAPFVVRAVHKGLASERVETYVWVLAWEKLVSRRIAMTWYPIF